MRVLFSLLVCLAAVFLMTILTTAVGFLSADVKLPESMAQDDLTTGRIHLLFGTKEFWQAWPSVPDPMALVHVPTIVFSAVLLVLVFIVVGLRTKLSPVSIAFVCLLTGAVPYMIGFWALSDGSVKADHAGKWLTVMLLGVLYAAGVCNVLAALDFVEMGLHRFFARMARAGTKPLGKPAVKGS